VTGGRNRKRERGSLGEGERQIPFEKSNIVGECEYYCKILNEISYSTFLSRAEFSQYGTF